MVIYGDLTHLHCRFMHTQVWRFCAEMQEFPKHLQTSSKKIQFGEFQKKTTPSKLEILILYIARGSYGDGHGVPPSRRWAPTDDVEQCKAESRACHVAQLDDSWGWGPLWNHMRFFVSKMMEIPEYPQKKHSLCQAEKSGSTLGPILRMAPILWQTHITCQAEKRSNQWPWFTDFLDSQCPMPMVRRTHRRHLWWKDRPVAGGAWPCR